jgi:hypothetical protein
MKEMTSFMARTLSRSALVLVGGPHYGAPRMPSPPLLALRRAAAAAAVALAAGGALVAAAPASATTETASSGPVAAAFSYTKAGALQWKDLRVQVTRNGVQAFDGVPAAPDCKVPYCVPAGAGNGSRSLRVVDLDADGEPEILVDLYTGGAHCCSVTELLRWTGTGYAAQTRDWADAGYTLVDAPPGGVPAFISGDVRFAYAFASFADSRFPVQVLTFKGGTWHDVTRARPETLRAESARLAREYRRRRSGEYALGVLAAWVADQYRLGRRATADRFVAAELRAGRLRGAKAWPRGKAYVKLLRRSLRAWGYAKA